MRASCACSPHGCTCFDLLVVVVVVVMYHKLVVVVVGELS